MLKCMHFPWREIEKKNGHRNKNNQSHMGGPVLLISFPKICGLDVFRSLSLCTQSEMNCASFPLPSDCPIQPNNFQMIKAKMNFVIDLTWCDGDLMMLRFLISWWWWSWWWCSWHDVLSKKPDADTFKCLTHSLISDWNLIEYYYGRHN